MVLFLVDLYSWSIRYLVDWPSEQKPTIYKRGESAEILNQFALSHTFYIVVANINQTYVRTTYVQSCRYPATVGWPSTGETSPGLK